MVTTVSDTMPPVVGGSGVLTLAPTDATTMSMAWTMANDDVYPQATLQYKVVCSSANNIADATTAEANGTVVLDWTANVATASVTSLTAGAQYTTASAVVQSRSPLTARPWS